MKWRRNIDKDAASREKPGASSAEDGRDIEAGGGQVRGRVALQWFPPLIGHTRPHPAKERPIALTR